MCVRGTVGWTYVPPKLRTATSASSPPYKSWPAGRAGRRPNRVAYRTHPAPASRRRSASAASHTARSSHSPSAVARCRAHPRLPAFPLCRLCTGLRRSAGGGICARVPNHAPTRPPARSHAALSSPRPSAPRALALTPTSPPSVAQTVHCGTAHCRWLGRRPRDRMAEPSNESLVIERSLLELYEPNAHAAPVMAIDFLHDLARRSATMPSALSEDLLNRQRVTANLRLHMEAALIRVACTHADVRIEDNGHGAWLVSGLQPRANTALCTTATPAPACPDGHARHLPSRSKRSSHPLGPKRARLANPEAEILPPGTKFQWKGRTYEIDRHDRMQSTPAKQYYHLRRDGKPLGSSYARDRHWIVEAPPTSRLEESLLGFASTVADWETIGAWGDETVRACVCRGDGTRALLRSRPPGALCRAHRNGRSSASSRARTTATPRR